MRRGFATGIAFAASLVAGSLVSSASASVLLVNNGNKTGATTLSGSAPYAAGSGAIWNNGGSPSITNFTSPLQYADGSTASGVNIVTDGDSLASGTAVLNFATSPAVSELSGTAVGTVFNADPALDSVFVNNANGVLGVKITGLPAGTYDVYVVAAYLGATANNRPAGSTPSRQAIWAFTDADLTTLTYTSSTGTMGTHLQDEILENSTASSWVTGNNYAVVPVTVSAAQPALYVALSAEAARVGPGTQNENRPFLNLIEVVPEPSAVCGLLLGLPFIGLSRRRRV
jgi:hypothetical protein